MLAYYIGVFLGAALQPSTIIVLILSLILSESKKSFIIILLIILCIAQWILKAVLGSSYLSFWPVIVSFLIGYFLILIIYSQKRKNKTKINEIPKEEKDKIRKEYIKKTINLFILFIVIILLYNFTPFKKLFQKSETQKVIYEGYTQVKKDERLVLEFDNKKINNDVFQYIHYKNQNKFAKELDFFENQLNSMHLNCVEGDRYDIGCLTRNSQPFFDDVSCLWTFNSYAPIASEQNYYLININERACGTYPGEFNSYYLVRYDGETIDVVDSIPAGKKHAQRAIEFYKINDDGFSIITETCYRGADTCKGIKPDFLELKF